MQKLILSIPQMLLIGGSRNSKISSNLISRDFSRDIVVAGVQCDCNSLNLLTGES